MLPSLPPVILSGLVSSIQFVLTFSCQLKNIDAYSSMLAVSFRMLILWIYRMPQLNSPFYHTQNSPVRRKIP
ncbi:hypothetical protein L2E82_21442 [Cichorium intybus]|uniref:Uncharacterized protein n=1 Tax=Cichorium intybus TaxID=13427 RepID=A0ACB9DWJ6_CICIN|nr:hypothetical protein L2E82_21442 [Cichorium intybus]